ncbi:MAG: response regulator transcription factor [Bacteroidetes bacterium]|nr:response regulator transcription factor [Bacteroidota bacterium]MBS1932441.1 response regulator transcription factor [Bacteroidota bacterium]
MDMKAGSLPLNILIADDHELMRNSLERVIHQAWPSAYIELVGNGRHLLDSIKTREWDIIITDNAMPEITGIQAIAEIRKHSPHIPILLISINSGDVYAAHAYSAGASAYLAKDKLQDRLIEAIDTLLNGNNYFPELNWATKNT